MMGGMGILDDLVGENPSTGRAAGELVRLLERESRPGATAPNPSEMRRRNETKTGTTMLARLVHWFIGRARGQKGFVQSC
jgi:hypothetical protein